MTTQLVSLQRVADIVAGARRVLVCSHSNPDGDAIGSTLLLSHALWALGKDAIAFNVDRIPASLGFMEGVSKIVRQLPSQPVDVTVVVDCADLRAFGDQEVDRGVLGHIVGVDHHQTYGTLCSELHRDVDAAATTVLVWQLVNLLKVSPTRPMAEAAYCGLLSDTGSFRYQNTTPFTFRLAAELLEHGLDPWRVASNIFETRPKRQLELLSRVLPTLQVSADGVAAALHVTDEMMQATGCTPDMSDGFVNYARGIEGVEVAALFRWNQGAVRVSLRSRGTVDVSRIAACFGGGGHHNAAGYTAVPTQRIESDLFEAVAQALKA